MKFAKIIWIASFSMCLLLGLLPRAMSRDRVPSAETASTMRPVQGRAGTPVMILYGTPENADTRVPPPPLQKRSQRRDAFWTEQPQFTVTYNGFTDEARAAFQYAVDIWDSLIRSPVPIRIDATFRDLGGTDAAGNIILGEARPADWKSIGSLNVLFVDALADQQAGRDLAQGKPDIITKFNSHADANWYFGTDGNPSFDQMDFVSVVLHEIAHGLGFFSFARKENFATFVGGRFSPSGRRGELRVGTPKLPYIYDFHVVNESGAAITSFRDPSMELLAQLTSNNLFWNGNQGVAANGGSRPQLYAPSSWEFGSSYGHLDETTFPAGDVNSLMTPVFARKEAVHTPGPITLGMFSDMGWSINNAPVFAEGTQTTRTVPENTDTGVSIGKPLVATDPNGEPLLYSLSGRDAESFEIDSTSGQLKTKAPLHHGTQAAYTVTVIVSDGRLTGAITVIITVIKIQVEVPANSAPTFKEEQHTTRTVAENMPSGRNIGLPVTAADADNDALTYTLGGPDAAAFNINRHTGQLRTQAPLDYETRRAYTVTVIVSDGNLTDAITVTINVTDLPDQKSPALTLTSVPLSEATLNGSIVTLRLGNRVYEDWLNDPVSVSGLAGVTVRAFNVERANDTTVRVQLTFDGTDFDTNASLTFTLKADAIANYNGAPLTATTRVVAVNESIAAASTVPITESTLNGSVVTLTLKGRIYESRYTIGNNVTVSGITGATVNRFRVKRIGDRQVSVELRFDGTDFDTDRTLTFKVGADAIAGYTGTDLIARVSVRAVVEQRPTVTAWTPRTLTEATLNESIVTLTLSSGVYIQSSADIGRALQVSGIAGVTVDPRTITRISDTKITAKLTFDGTDFDTNAILIFTIGAGAIVNYNGPARIARIPVTAVSEENPTITPLIPLPFTEATLNESAILLTLSKGTYVPSNVDIENAVILSGVAGLTLKASGVNRISDTQIAIELTFDGNIDTGAILTFTVGADAIAGYEGPALIVHVSVSGGQESVVASTKAPLTETTLNGSTVTLTLSGATYQRSIFDLRDAVSVSGIDGVTFHWFDVNRISDTELSIELTFNGNLDTDATLIFTVDANAIAGYEGAALTAAVPVTANTESLIATPAVPLTEATLDASVVTLTLTDAKYVRSLKDLSSGVSVSGIAGVTVERFGINRHSDTEMTVELEFNGNIDTDSTLIFTVGAGALWNYDGPTLAAQVSVTGDTESLIATTTAPLTEATLDASVVTLTLTDAKYVRSLRDLSSGVSVSGITGVTVERFGINRHSDTEMTVELEFNGNIDTDSTLTFTVGAGALWNYDGPALTAVVPVTATHESLVATTAAPLTEATLDGSVVTLTLTGAKYIRSLNGIRGGVSVSGIPGVRIKAFGIDRHGDTEIRVKLEFNGDFDVNSTLTFTVGADALWNYKGPVLTVEVPVTAIRENFLLANFPNPFNPETWIPYQLAKPADVTLTIYDIRGRVVRALDLGHQSAGIYQSRSRAAYWDGRNALGEPVASGLYFYTLTAGDFTATRKMLIMK